MVSAILSLHLPLWICDVPGVALLVDLWKVPSIDGLLVDHDGGGLTSRLVPALEQIRDSLRVLDAARYKRDGALDLAALDVALDNGAGEIQRLRYANVWWVRRATQIARTVPREGGVWQR